MTESMDTRAQKYTTIQHDILTLKKDLDAESSKNSAMFQEIMKQLKELNTKFPPSTSSENTQTDDRGISILGTFGDSTATSHDKGKPDTKFEKMECPKDSDEDFPGWVAKIEQFFKVDNTKKSKWFTW